MALEIFKLKGSIFVDTDKAEKSISKTESKAGKMASSLSNGAKKVAKFGAAAGAGAAAAVAGVTKLATSAANTADRVDKMSQKIGISREAYQELDFICSQSGANVDNLRTGMKTLTNQMQSAESGGKLASGMFDTLGVSVTDANGNLKGQEEMLWETLDALQKVENQTERASLANDLFGKSGSDLMPLINGARGSIEEMKEQAHDLGLVMSDESVDAGVKLTDTMDQTKRSFGAIATQLGVKVMPIVQKALDFVIKNMPKIQKTVRVVFNNVSKYWKKYGKPVFNSLVKACQKAFNIFKKYFPKIKDTVNDVFKQIKKFWNKHLKPCFEAIKKFVQDILWPIFKKVFKHLILPVIKAVFNTVKTLWNNTLKPVFTAIVDFVKNVFSGNFTGAFKNVLDILKGIWDGLVAIIKTPVNEVIGVINSFIGRIIGGINFLIGKLNSVSIKVPKWVQEMTGMKTFGFNIKELDPNFQIPLLAKGGETTTSGRAIVGEDGAEMINLPKGARVTPLNKNNNAFEDTNATLDKLLQLLEKYLPLLMNRDLVLDTGATVGALVGPMDKALAERLIKKKRGV